MGFMDLSIVGSDTASDLAWKIEREITTILKDELKEKHFKYNTPSFLNVAFIFEDFICKSDHWQTYGMELKKLAKKVVNKLNRVIKKLDEEKDLDAPWVERCKELKNKIEDFIGSK